MYRRHSAWMVIAAVALAGCALAAPRPPAHGGGLFTTTLADVEQRVGVPRAAWPGLDRYPTADAVDLVRTRHVRLLPDGTVAAHEQWVTKILTERGKSYGQITIPFDAQLQRIQLRWAQTVRPDGTIVPIAQDAVGVVSPFQSLTAFSSMHIMVVSMPSVEPGCVVDLGYDVTTQPSLMGNHLWDDVVLSHGAPVLQAFYTVTVPSDQSLHWQTRGVPHDPEEARGPAATSYTWSTRNLAPIELEPQGPPLRDVLPWVSVSTVRDWAAVAQWWRQIVLQRVAADQPIQEWVRAHTTGVSEPQAKLRAIFEGLQREIRYVALEFGRGGYEPHWAQEVFANRYGDCKDQVVLLLTMLQEAGITAGPALLRVARAGPMVTEVPSPGEFNHAVVWADVAGQQFWLDPASGVCPLGEMPPDDAGVQALLLVPGGWRFQDTPPADARRQLTSRTAELQLQEDGACRGTVVVQAHGWAAADLRFWARGLKPEQAEVLAQGVARRLVAQAVVTERRFPDWHVIDALAELAVSFEGQHWATPLSDDLVFLKSPEPPMEPPGLNQVQRRTAWWGTPETLQDGILVKLPDHYTIHTLPKPFQYDDANCTLGVVWTQGDQQLVAERTMIVKTRAVAPDDWPAFRAAFLAFEQAATQPVVLKRR